MTKVGKLSVKIKSDSEYFGSTTPIEIRDSRMRLVQRSRDYRQFDLPVGLYEVSSILEDGHRYSQAVQILAGERTSVEIGVGEHGDPLELVKLSKLEYVEGISRLKYFEIELLELKGASLKNSTNTRWVIECRTDRDSVPTALIKIGNQMTKISLPISNEREFPYNSCVVEVEETSTNINVNASISPERTVANALQNMLASGYVLQAAELADDAINLLQHKYSDPTGAALGALILHKVGRLENWVDWVKNLANDFDWLPDGKALLANLMYNEESNRETSLKLALQASNQRMLYTESYSLLLNLLRRWPHDSNHELRQQAISRLTSSSLYINWESICFNQVL